MTVRSSRPSHGFGTRQNAEPETSILHCSSLPSPPVPNWSKGGYNLSIDLQVWRQLGLSRTLGPKWKKHMEKEFQQKNLVGPGVFSSVVDTARAVIYATSVTSHFSQTEISSAQKRSCLGVLREKPQSWVQRQPGDWLFCGFFPIQLYFLAQKHPQQCKSHFHKCEIIVGLFCTSLQKTSLSSEPFK